MDYPAPLIPLSPVLSWQGMQLKENSLDFTSSDSILSNSQVHHLTSGRASIAIALEHAGLGENDEILIPAYHCESMISPALWRKASPVFYKVNMDTTVDIEDLQNKISESTRAIMVTHYFGFIQNMPPIIDFCERHGLVLVEDCAHAFFGSKDGKSVGTWGDYAIASSMKFFPVFDGGIVASSTRSLNAKALSNPSTFFEIKSSLNVLQRAVEYKRLGTLGAIFKLLAVLAESTWRSAKKLLGRERSGIHGPSSSGGGYGLEESWIHIRASRFSKMVISHQRKDRLCSARRRNYLKLDEKLSALPHSRPLFEQLPDGIVPLVYPLYVEAPELHFDRLKRAGVPIWRFGEFLDDVITDDLCKNTVKLSKHVFQFPCHQELTDSEIDWMVAQVSDSFSNEGSSAGKKNGLANTRLGSF